MNFCLKCAMLYFEVHAMIHTHDVIQTNIHPLMHLQIQKEFDFLSSHAMSSNIFVLSLIHI